MRGKSEAKAKRVLQAGALALLITEWSITGAEPAGKPFKLTGRGTVARMKTEDIARLMSVSQKTVKRRLEFMIRNHVLDFGIVYNPSAMKGYIYFGLIIQTEHYRYQRVLEQVYLNFERYLLRHPDTVHEDVIILNMYSRSIYDIESILKNVESFKGVTKAEIFQTLKTEILDKWVIEEIDNLLLLR
jgi:DNA-binding Lrp family transcriptional regulator